MNSLYHSRIEYFLKCATERSFQAACLKLGITQPSLSTAIKKLEEDMNTVLFERGRHGIRLTAEGKALYDRLAQFHRQMQTGVAAALNETQPFPLRVGCIALFGYPVLESLAKIEGLPPLQVFQNRSILLKEAIDEGKLDLAIVSWTKPPKGTKFIDVKSDPTAVVGLRRRFKHIEIATSLEELQDEPWVYHPKPQYDWTAEIPFGRPGFVITDSADLRHLVLRGHGIAESQLSFFTKAELRTLVVSRCPPPHPNVRLYILYRKDISEKGREVVERLAVLLRAAG